MPLRPRPAPAFLFSKRKGGKKRQGLAPLDPERVDVYVRLSKRAVPPGGVFCRLVEAARKSRLVLPPESYVRGRTDTSLECGANLPDRNHLSKRKKAALLPSLTFSDKWRLRPVICRRRRMEEERRRLFASEICKYSTIKRFRLRASTLLSLSLRASFFALFGQKIRKRENGKKFSRNPLSSMPDSDIIKQFQHLSHTNRSNNEKWRMYQNGLLLQ